MKKLFTLVLMTGLVFSISACTTEVEVEKIVEVEVPVEVEKIVEVVAEPIAIPAEVTMENIDSFVERENVQLVDLRNFADKYKTGYISGFETISFFEFLDGYAFTRNTGWDFTSADITDAFILENFFDKDADAIFLMCGSGTRAGYVKAALEDLGYTNVYNVGGFDAYDGEFRVLGDGEFVGKVIDTRIPAEVTMANVDAYLDIPGVQLIDLRNDVDRHTSGYIQGSVLIDFFQYLEANNYLVRTDGDWTFAEEDVVDSFVLENMFDKDAAAIFLYCGSGTRAGFVKSALESLGYTNVYNIGGFSAYDGDDVVYGNAE